MLWYDVNHRTRYWVCVFAYSRKHFLCSYVPAIFKIASTVARNVYESCELINDRKTGLGVKYCRILFGSAVQVVCHEEKSHHLLELCCSDCPLLLLWYLWQKTELKNTKLCLRSPVCSRNHEGVAVNEVFFKVGHSLVLHLPLKGLNLEETKSLHSNDEWTSLMFICLLLHCNLGKWGVMRYG